MVLSFTFCFFEFETELKTERKKFKAARTHLKDLAAKEKNHARAVEELTKKLSVPNRTTVVPKNWFLSLGDLK